MEALSTLENANVLGRILTHIEDFDGYPKAYANFFKSVAPFHGHITYSSTNTAIDHYMSGTIALGPPVSACTPTFTPVRMPDIPSITNADQICILHDHVHDIRKYQTKPTPIGPHSTKSKHCHKCHKYGHICHECTLGRKKQFFAHYK